MKTTLLLATLFICSTGFSQTDKQIKEISSYTCDCLNEKQKDLKKANASQLQMELGLCMFSAASKAGYTLDLGDSDRMEAMGEKVGMELAMSCPTFLDLIGTMAEDDPDLLMDIINNDDEDYEIDTEITAGKVLSVTTGDFVTVKIESESGKKETFYWFGYFEGADLLNNEGSAVIGREILIEFESMECYSPKLEDYTNIKVLRGLYLEEELEDE